jgi:hypothetical protein
VNTPTRLAAFGVALVAALAAGAAIGAAVGPLESSSASHASHEEEDDMSATAAVDTHDGHPGPAATKGYRLDLDRSLIPADEATVLTFRVLGPDGSAVTAFDDNHERPMHLIVVSNDATGYAHLHPTLEADGTWSIELPALAPGAHRLFADIVPSASSQIVLTADLVVPGQGLGTPLPEPVDLTPVDDLDVSIDLAAEGDDVVASLRVRRAGGAVAPDPYLGARGHLVAIAVDDLGYLHVHPTEGATGDDEVRFVMTDPAPGRYRVFFDFSVDDRVRTAAFTVDLPAPAGAAGSAGHTHSPGDERP